ncbi:MAG: repressor LexA [Planctomycetes bacterium]|nr:repressor LexA [Planctomycetota bacterium]
MTLPISRRQMGLLNAFRAFVRTHGRTPSVRELGALLGRSASTVHQTLSALARKKLLVNGGGAHGWRLGETALDQAAQQAAALEPLTEMLRVPIRGAIAAGRPIEAIDDPQDALLLPRDQVREGTYALRVQGDSMREDHILDGDIVLVEPQPKVEDGEIAVALLEDGTATLKRVYRDARRRKIRLQPANGAMKALLVDQVEIQGKAVGIYRKLG